MTAPDLCPACHGKDPDEWCDSCAHSSMQPELARQQPEWNLRRALIWNRMPDPDPVGSLEEKGMMQDHREDADA